MSKINNNKENKRKKEDFVQYNSIFNDYLMLNIQDKLS